MLPGCVKVLSGEYEIRGHEVNSIVGAQGSGRPIEIGKTDVTSARRSLGTPLIRYENDTTDIFDASPRYRWIVNWWPVALNGQSGPHDPHVLLRLDYGARGLVEQHAVASMPIRVYEGTIPPELLREWPDLKQRRVAAFGGD
jgi:hypothetical protein